MEGPFGIAIGVVLVIGTCIQLAVALRNRYINTYRAEADGADAEKDAASFASELELQLQGELEDAINSSANASWAEKASLIDISPAGSAPHVSFHGTSSWSTFKSESRAKLQQFARTLVSLSTDDSTTEDSASIDTDPKSQKQHAPTTPQPAKTGLQHSPRRQLPLLDADGALAEKTVLVNGKQFHRIMKRRMARQVMEEHFQSPSLRRPGGHAVARSMRRSRGPGGRVLTADEVHHTETASLPNGLVAIRFDGRAGT